MIKLILDKKYEFLSNKFNYLLQNFHTVYQINKEYKVYFGNKSKENIIRIVPGEDIINFFTKDKPVPKNYIFLTWNGVKIPLFFKKTDYELIISKNIKKNVITINYDILSSAFYLLSSWQEWMSDKVDTIGRFPAIEHFLFQHDLLTIPVVNYYFDILKNAMESFDRKSNISLKNKQINCFITHDIDRCKTGWKENSARALMDGHPLIAAKTIFDKMFNRDIWFNFDTILNIEKRNNIKSTFFFIPDNSGSNIISDADYSLNSKEMTNILQKIKALNHEIGIHGSFNSGLNYKKLKQNIDNFPVKINGSRFHYLAIHIPQTYNLLEKSNLNFDSSLGFPDHIGFRNGYCYPFFPYDIQNDKPFTFVEFSLHIMDITLQHKRNMDLSLKQAIIIVGNLVEQINKFNGYFVLLWHNSFFTGYKYKRWASVFEHIIEICKKNNAEFLRMSDVNILKENNIKHL